MCGMSSVSVQCQFFILLLVDILAWLLECPWPFPLLEVLPLLPLLVVLLSPLIVPLSPLVMVTGLLVPLEVSLPVLDLLLLSFLSSLPPPAEAIFSPLPLPLPSSLLLLLSMLLLFLGSGLWLLVLLVLDFPGPGLVPLLPPGLWLLLGGLLPRAPFEQLLTRWFCKRWISSFCWSLIFSEFSRLSLRSSWSFSREI